MTIAAKTPPLRSPRKRPATPPQAPRGNLTKPEITKLLMQAQEAFRLQDEHGLIGETVPFDTWRREQVVAACGKPGLSKISRGDFRAVLAHFLGLCGRDAEAYDALTTTGPKRDHGPASDTHEAAEALVHHINSALARHAATALPDGSQHIHAGWLLAAARQRTRKPTLTMADLAARLDAATLMGLLAHLRNHISRREGRENPEKRADRGRHGIARIIDNTERIGISTH